MTLGDLERRFIALLRDRVRNGELSERRLAHLVGVSQPHLHNVLRGKRTFSIQMADDILRQLQLDVRNLIEPEEWASRPKIQ